MTPIQLVVPETLIAQKAELETALGGIAAEEEKLSVQRKDIHAALQSIATAVAVLSGQPLPASKVVTVTGRKPMSAEARQRIAEGLRRSAQARAAAKAAQGGIPAPQAPAPAPADAPVAISEPHEPAEAPADAPVPDSRRKPGSTRKAAKR
jgi:hypothetical protein